MPDYSSFPITDGVRTYLAKPPGYEVNFDRPQQQYDLTLYLIVGIGSVLAFLFMAQRLYTKAVLSKGFQLEDAFLVLSWVCSCIVQGVTIWSVGIHARGVHAWEQPIERYVKFRTSVYIGGAVFMPCASFAKLALLIFYLRLSPQIWFRNAIWITIGLIAVYSPAIFLALLFACSPVESSWRVDITGECIDTTALFIATCVVNILTDVIIFLLPIPTVLGLRMPLAQKLGVLALFSVGLITIITSVVRAAILPQMSGADQSWVTAWASVWSQLECNLLVICGTISTLKKFFRHVCPKILGSSWASGKNNSPKLSNSKIRSHSYRRRKKYAQFEGEADTDFVLTEWDAKESQAAKGVSQTVVVGGDARSKSDDDSSERGIIERRSVVIERE